MSAEDEEEEEVDDAEEEETHMPIRKQIVPENTALPLPASVLPPPLSPLSASAFDEGAVQEAQHRPNGGPAMSTEDPPPNLRQIPPSTDADDHLQALISSLSADGACSSRSSSSSTSSSSGNSCVAGNGPRSGGACSGGVQPLGEAVRSIVASGTSGGDMTSSKVTSGGKVVSGGSATGNVPKASPWGSSSSEDGGSSQSLPLP